MIYEHPLSTSKVDQGDIIDDCPLAYVEKYESAQSGGIDWAYATSRVIVLKVHTVRLDLLSSLCATQCRRARLTDLYRAHLGRHFADTYARIGLPEPYETE